VSELQAVQVRGLDLTLVYPETQAKVRVVGSPESPEWVAADVCAVLGIRDTSMALRDFGDDEKGTSSVGTPGGIQEVLTVREPGLYRLIFKSRKAEAERFRRWVCHEVLPAIRRTGTYSLPSAPAQPAPPPRPALSGTEIRLQAMQLWQFALGQGPAPSPQELLQFRDATRNLTLDVTGQKAVDEVCVSARCEERGIKAGPGDWSHIGRVTAELFRRRHGRSPDRAERLVGGAVRKLFVYTRADVDLLDEAIDFVMKVVPSLGQARDRRPLPTGARA
jgi:prophage antirepressor-like protein